MFLTVCDVFVEARTFEAVSLEELREDARVRVDHVDVGVAVVRESLSDVALEPLYGRRAPLGIQTSPALLRIEGEVNLVRVSIMLLQTFTKSLELRELPGVQAFRFDDAVQIFCVDDFATRVPRTCSFVNISRANSLSVFFAKSSSVPGVTDFHKSFGHYFRTRGRTNYKITKLQLFLGLKEKSVVRQLPIISLMIMIMTPIVQP
jgi:hypothetical protein